MNKVDAERVDMLSPSALGIPIYLRVHWLQGAYSIYLAIESEKIIN